MVPLNYAPLNTTPWAHSTDLPQIRSIIFRLGPNAPPAEDRRQHAVDLLEAWKMRGGLPHAMDATCLLLNAILNASNNSVTHLSARSVYAVAWTRFVTGFCDLGRDSRYRGASMFKVAKEIGMPIHFVELRHEIGHEGLPSLQHLSRAAEEGMTWLWTHFWADLNIGTSKSIGKLSVPAKNLPDEMEISLAEYRRARKENLRSGTGKDSASSTQTAHAKAMVSLVDLSKQNASHLTTLVTSLVKIGYLVPKNRQLGSAMDMVYTFWDTILLELSGVLGTFVSLLLRQLTLTILQPTSLDESLDPFREALQAWVSHILSSPSWLPIRMRHDEAMRGETLRVCHGSGSPVAVRLARKIISTSNEGLFKDTQSSIFADPENASLSSPRSKKRRL